MRNIGMLLAHRINLDPLRVAQQSLGDRAQAAMIERRRKQQRLTLRTAIANDRQHIISKSHVEHPVGFVEHEKFQIVQISLTGFEKFQQPPRSSDQDFRIFAQGCNLMRFGFAAGNYAALEACIATETHKMNMNLPRQLTGWHQNQGAGAPVAARCIEKPLHDRQQKCRRFAGTGRG